MLTPCGYIYLPFRTDLSLPAMHIGRGAIHSLFGGGREDIPAISFEKVLIVDEAEAEILVALALQAELRDSWQITTVHFFGQLIVASGEIHALYEASHGTAHHVLHRFGVESSAQGLNPYWPE